MLDSAASGQETLEHLDHSNLFIVPLDDERRWYRYHHLFGELLRQRLGQSLAPGEVAALHRRASAWCEQSGLLFEAFRHAVAANDVARAARLIEHTAAAMLAQTEQTARQRGFTLRLLEIAAAQVLVLLHKGHLDAAEKLV